MLYIFLAICLVVIYIAEVRENRAETRRRREHEALMRRVAELEHKL